MGDFTSIRHHHNKQSDLLSIERITNREVELVVETSGSTDTGSTPIEILIVTIPEHKHQILTSVTVVFRAHILRDRHFLEGYANDCLRGKRQEMLARYSGLLTYQP
jgi:hypothetical protein